MYVLYNIQGNVLLIKLMRKLYQILYNVGRLTYAPARRAFFFLEDTLAVGGSLSGGLLGSGRFPFRGTLGQWAGLGGGKALGQWAVPFQGDTWAMGGSLSGGHLGSGRFPFRETLWQWAGLRGGKALGVTKPAFPPRAPPFRARRCSALWYVTMY